MTNEAARRSPYQGLVPYTTDDAEWFFGRDEWVEVIADNLRAYRVSILYGASGVGKSSLLEAGLIPGLYQQARGRLAEAAPPGLVAVPFADWSSDDPAEALKQSIRVALGSFSPKQGAHLPGGSLVEVLGAAAERIEGVVFVVLDQLEEYFLYHDADEVGRQFEEELTTALRRASLGTNFLLSIREDGVAKLDRFQARVPGLLDNLIRLEHLDGAAAREAITFPLERWNKIHREQVVTIEPELVDEILGQVGAGRLSIGEAPGAGRVSNQPSASLVEAPYLQLVLTRLWDEERAAGSNTLRLGTLQRLGGADEIVRTHLDTAMALLTRREQDVAERIFRQLVTPSGTKIAHRARDLSEYAETQEDVTQGLLSRLASDARILRPLPGGKYEIYHDALAGPILAWRTRYRESERGRLRLRRRLVFLILCLAFGTLVSALYLSNSFASLERRAIDDRFAIRGSERPDARVALVGIDSATFQALNARYPFRRSLHAQVIDNLRRDGARVIAYDIEFAEPTTPREDNALVSATMRARGKIVFAATEISAAGKASIFGGAYEQFGARAGWAVLPADGDGVIRRLPYAVNGLRGFAVVAAARAGSTAAQTTRLHGNSAWIDYAGPPGTFRAISFARVLRGQFKPGTFRGRIVVVGATAPSFQDLHSTPTARSATRPMSGPEVEANAIATALRGFPLGGIGDSGSIALIVCLGLLAPLAAMRLRLPLVFALGMLAAAAYLLVLQLAFQRGFLLPASYPLVVLLVTAVGALFVDVGLPSKARAVPSRQERSWPRRK